MKSNHKIQEDVMQALRWDGNVDHTHIEVSADHESVTLSGFVADKAQKIAAEKIARSIPGVKRVVQHLKVAPQPMPEETSSGKQDQKIS
jgi:osmotically-inducible protein OsmY